MNRHHATLVHRSGNGFRTEPPVYAREPQRVPVRPSDPGPWGPAAALAEREEAARVAPPAAAPAPRIDHAARIAHIRAHSHVAEYHRKQARKTETKPAPKAAPKPAGKALAVVPPAPRAPRYLDEVRALLEAVDARGKATVAVSTLPERLRPAGFACRADAEITLHAFDPITTALRDMHATASRGRR